ncbi:hypothetical protein [Defluviimonas salinarum]|uniref:Uncharacterized protein n=1 Tax=Defluviimonas salinarum TaxID=2992147 RepID=A0ABT3J5C4_9RHOB|nr:hypothetical protein [Defluviimonas salinarum]MCW3782604.1 hypothetical protein [Defluviimonas salinarum]
MKSCYVDNGDLFDRRAGQGSGLPWDTILACLMSLLVVVSGFLLIATGNGIARDVVAAHRSEPSRVERSEVSLLALARTHDFAEYGVSFSLRGVGSVECYSGPLRIDVRVRDSAGVRTPLISQDAVDFCRTVTKDVRPAIRGQQP